MAALSRRLLKPGAVDQNASRKCCPGGNDERRCKSGEEVQHLRGVLSVLFERTFGPHLPPPAFCRFHARAVVPRRADRHAQSVVAARRSPLRLRLCLDRPLRVREEPAGLVQTAAVQLHGRLEDVLADPDRTNRVLAARAASDTVILRRRPKVALEGWIQTPSSFEAPPAQGRGRTSG